MLILRRWWFLLLAVTLAAVGVVLWVTADFPLLYSWDVTPTLTVTTSSDYSTVIRMSPDQWVIGRQRALGLGLVVLALVVLAAGTGYRLGRRRA